jgi:hypothetical protein
MIRQFLCFIIKMCAAGFFGYASSLVYTGPGALFLAGVIGSLGVSSIEFLAWIIARDQLIKDERVADV